MEADGVVDLAFQVQGKEVPADHGYLLYAAIARELRRSARMGRSRSTCCTSGGQRRTRRAGYRRLSPR